MIDNRKSSCKLLVFLSHANEDKRKVRELCKRLKDDGFDPWLDEEQLLPGQDWNLEIEKALRKSDAILLCFSEQSVQKEGYVQREFKRAQYYAEEKPAGMIYVIPVRLDECEIPFEFKKWQYVDYPGQYGMLVKALNARAGKGKAEKAMPVPKKDPAKRKESPKKHANGAESDGGPNYHFNDKVTIGTFINRDQHNTYYGDHITNINSPDEFMTALREIRAQLAALQQEDLTPDQAQEVQTAAEQVTEAAEEISQPEPDGEHINETLQKAQRTMDSLKGSIGSAVSLGTTLAGLIKIAMKLFGG